ncbi:MAG: tRNA dihydrouridine synthase [Bacteroidales bacterium]
MYFENKEEKKNALELILAPMEGITDLPFRILCLEKGADIVFTEFIAAPQLISGTKDALQKIRILSDKGITGVQIYGKDPEQMALAAKIASDSGAKVLDLNFGCSTRKVTSHGCGSALLKDLDHVEKIISSVVQASSLPVSVKTRLGARIEEPNYIDNFLRAQELGIAAFCLHGRGGNEKYNVKSRWEPIHKLLTHPGCRIPIIGNGDLFTPEDVVEKYNSGFSKLMIGRGVIGNPWIFAQSKKLYTRQNTEEVSIAERLQTVCRHLELNLKYKASEELAVREIRKHYDNYLRNWEDWISLRPSIMRAERADDVFSILGK